MSDEARNTTEGSAAFETHKFELACYLDGPRNVHPLHHSFDPTTGQWRFIFPISRKEAEKYEAEFLGSESKRFDDSAAYFKKARGPRRRSVR